MVNDICMQQNMPCSMLKVSNLKRAIAQKIYWGDNPKYEGAQQLMLGNIPVKFQDSMPDCS